MTSDPAAGTGIGKRLLPKPIKVCPFLAVLHLFGWNPALRCECLDRIRISGERHLRLCL
jgi:hypothetical protein